MAGKGKERITKVYKAGKYCPKCGPGVRLGSHANRLACGRCRYTEMVSAEKQ